MEDPLSKPKSIRNRGAVKFTHDDTSSTLSDCTHYLDNNGNKSSLLTHLIAFLDSGSEITLIAKRT